MLADPGVELEPRYRELQQQFRRFATDEVGPLVAADDEDAAFPHEAVARAAAHRYTGILVPAERGGLGLGNLGLSLFLTEVARVCPSTAVTLSVHNSLGASAISDYGSERVRAKYLDRLTRGELLGAYALTEPASGSDAAGLECQATRDGDQWSLTGTKLYVTSGNHAGMIVVFARTAQDPKKSRGISAFAVEPSFPGFGIGAIEDKLGIRASSTVELVLDNCRVPGENLLGEEGRGFPMALERLDGGRIGIASQALGMAVRAFEEATRAVRDLERDGLIEANDQWRHWGLAELATDIDAARLLIYRAARLRDAKAPHTKDGAMAKLFATQLANRAARTALSIAGAEQPGRCDALGRYFRDSRVTELYEGTTEIQKLVISREILRAADRT